MRHLIFTISTALVAFILTTSSLNDFTDENNGYEKELEILKKQPRRTRSAKNGFGSTLEVPGEYNTKIVHKRVKRGDPLKGVKTAGWRSRNFYYVYAAGGWKPQVVKEMKRHDQFMRDWKKLNDTFKEKEKVGDAKTKELEQKFAALKKKCYPFADLYEVDRFRRAVSPQTVATDSTKTQAAAAATTTATTTAAAPQSTTINAKGNATTTQENLSKKESVTNTNTKKPGMSLEKLKGTIRRITILRKKELLIQKVRNQKAEVEYEKKNMRIEELLHEMEEVKKSCEPKVRVKRGRRRRRRRRRRRHPMHKNFGAILNQIKAKHNAYLKKRAEVKHKKISHQMAAYKKNCIMIESRSKRSVPADYKKEQEKLTEQLKEMREERQEENKRQTGREMKDTNKINVLQGIINALEKQLKEQKMKCGIPIESEAVHSGLVKRDQLKKNARSKKDLGKKEKEKKKSKQDDDDDDRITLDPSKKKKTKKKKKKDEKKKKKLKSKDAYKKPGFFQRMGAKLKEGWGVILKKINCKKEGQTCKVGYRVCCGKELYCNPLLTDSSKTGICSPCIPFGGICVMSQSCCSRQCIKRKKANGKCGPTPGDVKAGKKKRKRKRKEKKKRKKDIEKAMVKAAKEEKKQG